MVNTRSGRACTNTVDSDNVQEEPVVANPFATNATAFAPFAESISGTGLPRRRTNAFSPAPSQPATVRVSNLHALGSPDQSEFEYQILYTADGVPIRVQTPRSNRTAIPTLETAIPPSPTMLTLADRMRQQLSTQAGPSRDRSSSLIPAEVPEEPEITEPTEEVSPDLPDHPEDPDPEGSDPEGPPRGPGGPGGPGSPPSSRGPSRSRSPPGGPGSNRTDIAEQRIIELFTTFRGTLNNLGGAITELSTNQNHGLTETAWSKVKDPEVFDGSNPRKLKGFLVSSSLVFIDRPTYFTDQRKINYTLSYLGLPSP
ncbi:hypothetical protein F5050DRAFT_1811023 [Lentinula boryana]|uniref:Uncharacterized protein n=1 Tax=Lentinula boryana TaxID=40481 RepID=A0ABQ8Q2S9_9AGAR|nr:hypothetical protein F5050DRAFT_1811023 [Lentinula boryana]